MAESGTAAVATCLVHLHPPTPHLFAPFSYTKSTSRLKSNSLAIKSPSKQACIRYKLGVVCGGRDGAALSCSTSFGTYRRTGDGQEFQGDSDGEMRTSKKRIFFLDVNPLCYSGSTPSLHSFVHWVTLFLSQVSLNHPVVAVIDGERGNEYRRQLLPSYKAHRMKFSRQWSPSRVYTRVPVERSHHTVIDFLKRCNIPVIKVVGCEADDVVATLVQQVLQKGYRAVIASPDKDFKQLISDDVQLVIPLSDLERWSFYTIKHYVAQYNCDPSSDLSLRCILGDEIDGVPGIQNVVPNFGRNTAIKLLKKHGSLENLLSAAALRTVGKQYVQEALTKYADYLLKNYQVLSLRRDIDVNLEDDWLCERDTSNDSTTICEIRQLLGEATKSKYVWLILKIPKIAGEDLEVLSQRSTKVLSIPIMILPSDITDCFHILLTSCGVDGDDGIFAISRDLRSKDLGLHRRQRWRLITHSFDVVFSRPLGAWMMMMASSITVFSFDG